jgi:hypothetical protein
VHWWKVSILNLSLEQKGVKYDKSRTKIGQSKYFCRNLHQPAGSDVAQNGELAIMDDDLAYYNSLGAKLGLMPN